MYKRDSRQVRIDIYLCCFCGEYLNQRGCYFFDQTLAEPLNTFVSHYEPLNYDRNHLEQTHQRVRRSTNEDKTLHLDFNAHGR